MMDDNKLFICLIKPYVIGNASYSYRVVGSKAVGKIQKNNDSCYFSGALFDETNRFQGGIEWNRTDFNEFVESMIEITDLFK